MEILANLCITLAFETSHDVFRRRGPLYLHLFLVGGVYEAEEIKCIFRDGTLFLELPDSLRRVSTIYCQPGVSFRTLAGIFVVANVRIRDMLSSSYSVFSLFSNNG